MWSEFYLIGAFVNDIGPLIVGKCKRVATIHLQTYLIFVLRFVIDDGGSDLKV